jgi:hypothetical protein
MKRRNLMPYIAAVATAIAVASSLAAVFLMLAAMPMDTPAKALTVYDRAVWGIGEDGTRIAPQPEIIHIILE